MARYFITGAAGFIGSHLTRFLLAQGHAVTGFDNLRTGRREALGPCLRDINFIVGDIQDHALLAKSMVHADYVVHLAALSGVPACSKDPALAHAINVYGTTQVFHVARTTPTVQRVIYASSAAIYGTRNTTHLHEDLPHRPSSAYGATKAIDELWAEAMRQEFGQDIVGLRFFNVYGPGQDPDGGYAAVIPAFVRAVGRGSPMTIEGDGLQVRDFIHVSDVAQACTLFSSAPILNHSIYNIGTGEPTSVLDLAHCLIQNTDAKSGIVHVAARPGDIRTAISNSKRAAADVNFSPNVHLQDGLRETFASFFSQAA